MGRSRNSVITRLPDAAPWIGIRFVFKLGRQIVRCHFGFPLKTRKKKMMSFHQILQGRLIIVMPARVVDVKRHWNVFRTFKTDGFNVILSICHSLAFHQGYCCLCSVCASRFCMKTPVTVTEKPPNKLIRRILFPETEDTRNPAPEDSFLIRHIASQCYWK